MANGQNLSRQRTGCTDIYIYVLGIGRPSEGDLTTTSVAMHMRPAASEHFWLVVVLLQLRHDRHRLCSFSLQDRTAHWMGPVPLTRRPQDGVEEPALQESGYMTVEEEPEFEYVWLGQLYNYFGVKGGFETLDVVRLSYTHYINCVHIRRFYAKGLAET